MRGNANTNKSPIAAWAATAAALVLCAVVWTGSRADAQQASDTPAKVATLDIFTLIEAGMTQDQYTNPRDEVRADYETRLQDLSDRIERIRTEAQLLQPGDPQLGQLQQQFQQLQQEAQGVSVEAQQFMRVMTSEQAVEIYRTAAEVGKRLQVERGYTHLIITRDADRDFNIPQVGDSIQAVTQEILARPVIGFPEADDLTEAVRLELGIPDPAEIELEDLDATTEEGDQPAGFDD